MVKMSAEGLDPAVLDMDPEGPSPGSKKSAKVKAKPKPTGPKLKPLYWEKVEEESACSGLIWAKWAKESSLDFDTDISKEEKKAMLTLFAVKPSSKKSKAGSEKQKEQANDKPKEAETVFSAFDSKRQFNLGIILKGLSKVISSAKLREALTVMDHDVVSMDLLDGLKKFLPEKEECEKITMYQEAPETEQKQMGVMNPLTAYMSEGIVGVKWLNNRMDCIRIQHEAIRFCNEAIDYYRPAGLCPPTLFS